MTDDRRRAELEEKLAGLLRGAVGAGRTLSRGDVIAAGVPARLADGVCRNSAVIVSDAEAVEAAGEWAEHITSSTRSHEDDLSVEELAAMVPRR